MINSKIIKSDTNNTNHHTNDTNIRIIGMLFVD